jgi:alpha-beta hydrolase superfamily lysophospholipase
MKAVLASSLAVAVAACGGPSGAPARTISFSSADGGVVFADLYGRRGGAAVVLAHGAVFDRSSWTALATRLAGRDQQAMAIDFRGYGRSIAGAAGKEGLADDILGAVDYFHQQGAPRVAVLGASMGGTAAAEAADRGDVDRLVLLSPGRIVRPARLRGPLLLVASSDEPAVTRMTEEYERLPEPKRLVLLPGTAHGQHIFGTDQAEALMAAIVDFLVAP